MKSSNVALFLITHRLIQYFASLEFLQSRLKFPPAPFFDLIHNGPPLNFSKHDCNSSIEESVLVIATGILFSNKIFCVVNLSCEIIEELGKKVFCFSSASSEITNASEEGWG